MKYFGEEFPFPNWWVEYQENYWDATTIGTELVDFNFIFSNLQYQNLFKIRSFGLPNEPYCRNSRSNDFCGQVETAVTTVQTGNDYQLLAEGMFNLLKELRSNKATFIANYISIPWAETEINENWGTVYSDIKWNEALARAGRQLLNDEGACQTFGDSNSNYYIDILRKYFVYEYQDVVTLKVVSPNLFNLYDAADNPRYALEWILSQEHIDKTLF